MASGYAPWWKRLLLRVPFLFKLCPGGNYHWRFDLYCHCRVNEHAYSAGTLEEGAWHGGVYCFRHQHEIHELVPGIWG
ncbi:hypothetical protein LCGC14_1887090 [marine sediment metagenome]|uniref:Uncharacterized protein n=1 Tax=marine sediment metagenome TaxID=412755 RepID=A0A0F9G0R5_9ZZZZ